MNFTGKKVIVTGANRSMGRQMAIAFSKQGADVVISYRSDQLGAEETIAAIQAKGQNAWAHYADFSQMENVATFAEQAISHLGHVDVLINNAATFSRDPLFELSPEKMQQVFQINTISPLYLLQLCAKNMVDNKIKGCILNISSIAGTSTSLRRISYSSSKAAMNKWTQNAALALAEHGVRVNAIAPGLIESGMNQETATTDPKLWDYYLSNIPLKRTGTPDDIANMALFLASKEAEWITGKIFEVDGGQVM